MILQTLLGDLSVADFLEQHYLKAPFARAGGCRDFQALGRWDVLNQIIAQTEVDVLIGREGQPFQDTQREPFDASALLSRGYTIGIRHAERHHPSLQALAEEFRHDLAAPIDIHVYCRPANQPGFGWHYDAEDVFLLQLQGSKEWGLRKNTVNPWPLIETLPANMRYEREFMPLMHCTLQAGDWLYLPAGYWHRGQAREESVSLSVGVASRTALDAFDLLRRRLLESLQWRQRLPIAGAASPFTTDELCQHYQELFGQLGQELAATLGSAGFAQAFVQFSREFPASTLARGSRPNEKGPLQ